jgi:anti-sigma regulatory factor (Ser/Thr protein kinase)
VRDEAMAAGFSTPCAGDFVLAVDEVASNSIRYGGGHGTVDIWRVDEDLVCEVLDGGRFTDPLVGRIRPEINSVGGRGLWLANQLCDLVQIRSFAAGAAVRLRSRRR